MPQKGDALTPVGSKWFHPDFEALTSEQIKLCKEGTWQEMSEGCNVFQPSIISNPGWFASIYSPDTPEIGLQAALVGQSED